MKMRLLLGAGVILAASSSLFGVTVDAMSNIFEAGLGAGGTSVGANMGLYPLLAQSITAGAGQTISFSSITGTVKYGSGGADPSVGGDGIANPFGNSGTNIASNTGISGIAFNGRVMFLIGVFLDANTPTPGTQPAGQTFFANGGGFDADNRTLWPSNFVPIGQTFYIGDGKTGNNGVANPDPANVTMVWQVPTTATRLFLGFADGGSTFGSITGGPFQGLFGAFNDNSGSLNVTVNTSGLLAAPEPGTMILMGLGLAAVGFLRKRIA